MLYFCNYHALIFISIFQLLIMFKLMQLPILQIIFNLIFGSDLNFIWLLYDFNIIQLVFIIQIYYHIIIYFSFNGNQPPITIYV